MNSNQRSALISFGYNLGAGFYGGANFNTISAALKGHNWPGVPQAMLLYSDPEDPKVHAGLLRRRIAEGALWSGDGPFAAVA
jgi:GH24 family phage-related lysozyme (muramidase)